MLSKIVSIFQNSCILDKKLEKTAKPCAMILGIVYTESSWEIVGTIMS